MDNDEKIRINIRTGTSTRPPDPRSTEIAEVFQPFSYRRNNDLSYLISEYGNVSSSLLFVSYSIDNSDSESSDMINSIISRSFNDTNIVRNPKIKLNIQQGEIKDDKQNLDCSICQDTIKKQEKVSILQGCNHSFHYDCLEEWGKYKQECPLCRQRIPILER